MNYHRLHRRDDAHYANQDERFHLVLNAHPKFDRWPGEIAEMLWESVMEQRGGDRVQLLAACLMPDHLHLLVGPGKVGVMKFAASFKSYTTRRSWRLGNKNALWQPRPFDRTIRSDEDFANVAEYILRNPVAAGRVEGERSWRHSWAWWWEA